MKHCPKDSKHFWNCEKDYHSVCTAKIIKPDKTTGDTRTGGTGWECTRKANHKGLHHAHRTRGTECVCTWTQTEALIEAL